MVVNFLSMLHAALGGSPASHRLISSEPVQRLQRVWLESSVLSKERLRPDNITVLIGVRNRADSRLANALASIREQTGLAIPARAMVVDYGSEPENARVVGDLCEQQSAEFVAVADVPVWSRSRCLNIGLRRIDTKFVMTSDADIILSPNYLSEAIRMLKELPLSVACGPMLDLPEESADTLRAAAEQDRGLQTEEWRRLCTPRLGWEIHPSAAVSYTAFYRLIRGYDEFYCLWGSEDVDLMARLNRLGLQTRGFGSDSYYLHQWHPKFEGIPGGRESEQISRNHDYYRRTRSILRNDDNWGLT